MMVVLDEPTYPGCLIRRRLIGMFRMPDEKGADANAAPRQPSPVKLAPMAARFHDREQFAANSARNCSRSWLPSTIWATAAHPGPRRCHIVVVRSTTESHRRGCDRVVT